MYTLQFDGLFRGVPNHPKSDPNVGFLCYGWLIYRHGAVVAHGHGAYARSNNATANIAEYLALIEGLDALLDFGIFHEEVWIVGDANALSIR